MLVQILVSQSGLQLKSAFLNFTLGPLVSVRTRRILVRFILEVRRRSIVQIYHALVSSLYCANQSSILLSPNPVRRH